ncbi:MAG: BRCT domain-containing protein, partial [Chthoniobacteraceae bacterium]
AQYFRDWVQRHAEFEPVWPFTDILKRVERIFADGVCDDEERQELKGIMQSICGHHDDSQPDENYSTTLPLCTPAPEPIVFEGKTFVITGRFAFGNRKKVSEAITLRGGIATDTTPSRDSNYLVVGLFASRDWIATNHGRKIERAVQLRESGSGIAIISEEHWRRFAA